MLVDRIWSQQPGKYFCLTTKSGSGKWEEHFFTKTGSDSTYGFDEVPKFLKDNQDKSIYFCPHGFSKPKRKKEYAVLPHLLWSDLDEANPSEIEIKPTIAIESSPDRYVGLWFTDGPVTEELNRRLSYHVGADKSGWDLTQVLRVPGTINYKYHSLPKARILWTDGPQYEVKRLEKRLPQDRASLGKSAEASDASDIYKEWERKFPAWVRRELLSGKPIPGKQSDMIWKLGNTLIEVGLSSEEVFVLLKASPWNKFSGRRNEDEQLEREIDKALNRHMQASRDKREREGRERERRGKDGDRLLIFRSMDEVEEEDIDWIWPSRIARGEVTILEGDPGISKSYLMQMVSKSICDGEKLPSDIKGFGGHVVRGKVLYFDLENSAATVTKKRLVWNHVQNPENYVQIEEPFSISNPDALDEIYEYAEKVRPVLMVFDTINSYLGGADAFKGHEIATSLGEFKELAKRFNCAVVIVRHLTKSGKERAMYRGQGSIQFTGTARVVLTVGAHPEDPDQRVLAVTKINIGPFPKALSFMVEGKPTPKDPYRSEFQWGEFVDFTSDDIISAPPKTGTSDKDDAKAFLKDQLEGGPVESRKLEKMAESRAISSRTLLRAADEMGVLRKSRGFGHDKRSFWSLPDDED